MENTYYTTTITLDYTPEEAFHAINNVRGWWSGEIGGNTDALGDVFTYRYKDLHYSKQQVEELIPNKKIVWRVIDANLTFVDNKSEWKDTKIVFEIEQKDGKTAIRFSHIGLTPAFECYDACSNGWNMLINTNLRQLINTGKTQEDVFEKNR